MSPAKYFFETKKDARDLPTQGSRRSPAVAAATSLIYGEGDVQRIADELMGELASPHTLMLDRATTRPFSAVFGLLAEFSRRYPTVTVIKSEAAMPSVSVSLHALYFAAATAVHHTANEGTPITLEAHISPSGDAVSVVITAERAAMDEEEALSILGLDGGRLDLLSALGERGGFIPTVCAKGTSEFRLTVKTSPPGAARVQAGDDPSLFAAFLLPLTYFCI